MVRILSSGARLIDIDFSEIQIGISRTAGNAAPTTVTSQRAGTKQLLNLIPAGATGGGGSFIQYQKIDLSFMVANSEMLQPTSVTVQRTSPVPLGSGANDNTADQVEEYIYILSRPLNNTDLISFTFNDYEDLRRIGLDGASPTGGGRTVGGVFAGYPDQEQCIYAEKRMYDINLNNAATVTNGILSPDPGINPDFWTLTGMPSLANVSTWGSLAPITGVALHCYRVVIDRRGSVLPQFNAYQYQGTTDSQWPPVNIAFVCEDPGYSTGEYITRLANAMNSIPIDGNTA